MNLKTISSKIWTPYCFVERIGLNITHVFINFKLYFALTEEELQTKKKINHE